MTPEQHPTKIDRYPCDLGPIGIFWDYSRNWSTNPEAQQHPEAQQQEYFYCDSGRDAEAYDVLVQLLLLE